MPNSAVSVIIPTYEDWEGLSLCLSALEKQDFPKRNFEIIIANNNKAADVPHDVILPTNAVVIHVATPGSYAARNAAIEQSTGQFLAFTDADCVPDTSWLSEAIALFYQNSEIDLIAGGVQFTWRGDKPNPIEVYDSIFNLRQEKFVTKGGAATANLFVRREVIASFGMFDANRLSGGDITFTKRATTGGATLAYLDTAIVFHPARHTLAEVIQKARRTTGAGILQKRRDGKKIIFPHLDRLLPPIRSVARITKSENVGFLGGVAVWLVLYLVNIVRVIEQARLILFKSRYERK